MIAFGCDEFGEIAPDLALGLLAGNERGAAISHLATCARCRRDLEGLVDVADDLLLLAPSVEPEIGFESRVMVRLAAGGAFSPSVPGTHAAGAQPAGGNGTTTPTPVRSRRWWARPLTLAVAAALVVVVGVTGMDAALNRGRHEGRTSALRLEAHAANQLSARTAVVWADDGRSTCQLVAFPARAGQPARLVIHLEEPSVPPDSYQVFAVPTGGGPAIAVGTIIVENGQGTLTAAIPENIGPVGAIKVTEGPGNTKYWASFAPV